MDVVGAGEGPGTEVFVGLKVPEGGLEMHGIELTYTDGQTTWTQVVPHAVRVCTSGDVADCPLPVLPESTP